MERNNINLTVGDLKDFLANVEDTMPVIIPVITEDDANNILGFRHVRTVGILEDEDESPENRTVLCLNSSAYGLDISSQVEKLDVVCKKVIF